MRSPMPTSLEATPAKAGPGARLRAAVTEAAAMPDSAARLAATGMTVRIVVSGAPDEGAVLLFDRATPIVLDHDADDPVVAEIVLPEALLTQVLDRTARLAVALIDGRASFTGPVREFLRVLPILIALASPRCEFEGIEGESS